MFVLILLFSLAIVAQPPSPRSVLGFTPADDRTIADWTQIRDYFTKLDAGSGKVKVEEFGKTTLGRPMIVAFISSEENIKNLAQYKEMNQKLADPRRIPEGGIYDELGMILQNGKTIVSISASIHSNEIVGSQMSMNLAYELATADDAETKEILDNTILLLIPSSNPDGIDIVANWYRKMLGTKSEGTVPPELYHHYAGHDNNRDWFMLNLKETQAITKLYWQEWYPQIVFDVHQMGQNGPRFVIPPFFDPPNPRIAPSIVREVGLIGYKMAADLQAKNIKGIATNTTFDMWWHGGFRSAPYYHNSIGILSEAASANLMSPATITKEQMQQTRPARGLNSPLENVISHPDPWEGGVWRPADINQIEIVASRALLQMAAKFRRRYLENFYQLNKKDLMLDGSVPKAFVIIAGQPNTEAISRFLEILRWQGIEVHEMTHELWVKHTPTEEFHEIPLGSFLVFTDQPQKRNVLSLFEKQAYPNRINPNGQPDPPYDVAGWTLPLQMGIETFEIWDIREREKYNDTIRSVVSQNQVRKRLDLKDANEPFPKLPNPLKTKPRIAMYKPYTSSMDEGWTRLVFDNHQIPFTSLSNADVRANRLNYDGIVLPSDQENTILNGFSADRYPEEFAGGIGTEGVANLKKFVENGGRLVCFSASCGMVIKQFGLPIKNVLDGLPRTEFYNPGSIVQLSLNRGHKLAAGYAETTPAYFINSAAFEVTDTSKVRTVASYSRENTLLSGWMLGTGKMAGKAALVETDHGKGNVVLFGFRPQHRGQTWATFRLIFNTLEK